jgi:Type I restriction enzyme R protein N terminus (HSDR_N)
MIKTAGPDIESLSDVERFFGIVQVGDRTFFPEWQTDLPEINSTETIVLNQIRDRFRYQRKLRQVAESMVNVLVVSPLLGLVGFYDPPFQMCAEGTIAIQTVVPIDSDDETEMITLRGRVDFLVLQNQFWQAIIESKETSFDIEMGIPQILAYMMGAPANQNVMFGMVTNGTHFVFVKLQRDRNLYGFSNTFSTLSDVNQLSDVLQVLKKISRVIYPN